MPWTQPSSKLSLMMNKTVGMTVTVGSSVYLAGHTEDGQDFVAERYEVVVTDRDGNRQVHRTRFNGAVVHPSFDGFGSCFEDVRTSAAARAALLAARVKRALALGHALSPECWDTERPEYGSKAYVQYGAAEDLAWEARCDEDERLGLR